MLLIFSQKKKLTTSLSTVNSILIDENSDIHYNLENNRSYIISTLKDDTEVLWSTFISAITTNPLATTLNTSKNTLLYIDLRFGNKVFYKFGKSGSIATSTETNINQATTTQNDTRILAKPNR